MDKRKREMLLEEFAKMKAKGRKSEITWRKPRK